MVLGDVVRPVLTWSLVIGDVLKPVLTWSRVIGGVLKPVLTWSMVIGDACVYPMDPRLRRLKAMVQVSFPNPAPPTPKS